MVATFLSLQIITFFLPILYRKNKDSSIILNKIKHSRDTRRWISNVRNAEENSMKFSYYLSWYYHILSLYWNIHSYENRRSAKNYNTTK